MALLETILLPKQVVDVQISSGYQPEKMARKIHFVDQIAKQAADCNAYTEIKEMAKISPVVELPIIPLTNPPEKKLQKQKEEFSREAGEDFQIRDISYFSLWIFPH